MTDRRTEIIEAGIAILREQGLSGFTQPRVAQRAGMRQSHLTYYFPTRLDLLAAVARTAIDNQVAALDATLDGSTTTKAARSIAGVVVRSENTRVLLALVDGADQEPVLRELFRELSQFMIERCKGLLGQLKMTPSRDGAMLVHALAVGLAVLNLAQDLPDGEARTTAVLKSALNLLAARE
jgi:AcrR family transcriptional regulator